MCTSTIPDHYVVVHRPLETAVVCRYLPLSRVSGIFRTRGVHLTGSGRGGAPELPLVKALGVADRTPGALNVPKQAAPWDEPASVGWGRRGSSAQHLASPPLWLETGGELSCTHSAQICTDQVCSRSSPLCCRYTPGAARTAIRYAGQPAPLPPMPTGQPLVAGRRHRTLPTGRLVRSTAMAVVVLPRPCCRCPVGAAR